MVAALLLAAPLLGLVALSGQLQAQQGPELHGELVLSNRHAWRGIRRAAGWNAQLQASAAVAAGSTRLAVGAWANVELATHRDGSLGELRSGQWGVSEHDLWAEVARPAPGGDLAAGLAWYQYRGRAGEAATGELFARYRGFGIARHLLVPEISLWYDPFERKAAYIEAGATSVVLAVPFPSPGLMAYSSAVAGFAVGRAMGGPALRSAWFTGTGLTHADLSTGIRLRAGRALGGLLVNLGWHVQYARDSSVRRVRLSPATWSGRVRTFGTLEVGLSWPPRREH